MTGRIRTASLALFVLFVIPLSLVGQSSKCCCGATFGGDFCLTNASVIPEENFDNGCEFGWFGTTGPSNTYDVTGLTCNGNDADGCALACSLLPIELLKFSASAVGSDVVLDWKTATETSNSGYQILYSADSGNQDPGFTWETVAFVEGRGTSSTPQDYSHTVAGLDPGTHQFRLNQIDFDGTSTLSGVVEVTLELPDQYVMKAAYPNPFNPSTTIRFAVSSDQRLSASLFNVLGNEVRSLGTLSVTANEMHDLRIDAGGLPSGAYLVRLAGEHFSASQRVMLLK